jgi:hypothetical protein
LLSSRSCLFLSRGSRGSWCCCGGSAILEVLEFRYIIFVVYNDSNYLAQFDILCTFREEELSDVTLLLHLEVDSCLVCLNLSKDIAWLYRVALLFEPLGNISLYILLN